MLELFQPLETLEVYSVEHISVFQVHTTVQVLGVLRAHHIMESSCLALIQTLMLARFVTVGKLLVCTLVSTYVKWK